MINATIQKQRNNLDAIKELIRLKDEHPDWTSEQIESELQRQEEEKMKPKPLSADLVVPVEQLFTMDLATLKALDQQMFEQAQHEMDALKSQGPYYTIMFDEQRINVLALTNFIALHPA